MNEITPVTAFTDEMIKIEIEALTKIITLGHEQIDELEGEDFVTLVNELMPLMDRRQYLSRELRKRSK